MAETILTKDELARLKVIRDNRLQRAETAVFRDFFAQMGLESGRAEEAMRQFKETFQEEVDKQYQIAYLRGQYDAMREFALYLIDKKEN